MRTNNYAEQVTGEGLKPPWGILPSRIDPGEESPAASPRVLLKLSYTDAYLVLGISDGASSGGTYDRIVGQVGAALPSTWFNSGTAAGDPFTIGVNTKELLKKAQLYAETFAYYLDLKDDSIKLGDYLENLFRLHAQLHGPIQTGPFALRTWARPADAIPITIAPTSEEVPSGGRLEPVRSLQLTSGIRLLDLSPEFARAVRLEGPRSLQRESSTSQAIRIWKPGNQLTDQAIATGGLSLAVRGFFQLLGGDPRVYPVAVAIQDLLTLGVDFGDHVYWSDSTVQTEDGLGFPANTVFLVLGVDVHYEDGKAVLFLLRDTLNDSEEVQSTTKIAPTLRVEATRFVSGTTHTIRVSSPGESDFNGTTAHSGVWAEVATANGLLHVVRPLHNPVGSLERPGWLEAYVTLTTIAYDGGRGESTFTVTLNAAWERGGFLAADLFVPGESFVSLPDRRPAASHLQNVLIEPTTTHLSTFAIVTGRHSVGRRRALVA